MKRLLAIIGVALFLFAACTKEEKSRFANTVWGIEEGGPWDGIEGTYYARIFDDSKTGRVIQWKDGEILYEYRTFEYVESPTELLGTDRLQSGGIVSFHFAIAGDKLILDNGDEWRRLE